MSVDGRTHYEGCEEVHADCARRMLADATPRVSDERLAAALSHAARAVITGAYAEEEMAADVVRDICADLRDARASLAALQRERDGLRAGLRALAERCVRAGFREGMDVKGEGSVHCDTPAIAARCLAEWEADQSVTAAGALRDEWERRDGGGA